MTIEMYPCKCLISCFIIFYTLHLIESNKYFWKKEKRRLLQCLLAVKFRLLMGVLLDLSVQLMKVLIKNKEKMGSNIPLFIYSMYNCNLRLLKELNSPKACDVHIFIQINRNQHAFRFQGTFNTQLGLIIKYSPCILYTVHEYCPRCLKNKW